MCGIVGAVSTANIAPTLLDCLSKLEYRGYDSAGLAVLNEENNLTRVRVVGKINVLREALDSSPLTGNIGIAHTRWATHGMPTEDNAHPHFSREEIGLVHNGIIENYLELREELILEGYKFTSETDTEVIVHLIHKHYNEDQNFLSAVRKTTLRLVGMYSLAIIHRSEPQRIIAVRCGSALVVGLGEDGANFIASDKLALNKVAEKFIYLKDGDIADLHGSDVNIYNASLQSVERTVHISNSQDDVVDREGYRHYMQKEIFEQPKIVSNILFERLNSNVIEDKIFGESACKIFPNVKRVHIVACGTSYNAGLVASYWLGELANLSCHVEVASEFRYRKVIVEPGTLFVAISQSGETADTLAALRQAKDIGYLAYLAICNVAESSLTREVDLNFFTLAGAEIGVASTKAFVAQLVSLLLLTMALGKYNGLDKTRSASIIQSLKSLPNIIETILSLDDEIASISSKFEDKQHVLYLGRGLCYPIAIEGALKMKEISYIHAEAYAAGELKHGPLALVDKHMPVVVLAPFDDLFPKILNNIKEVETRGGELFVFSNTEIKLSEKTNVTFVKIPQVQKEIVPIVFVIPLQLLAYRVALLKGTDIDQPRNLAKSVTVE